MDLVRELKSSGRLAQFRPACRVVAGRPGTFTASILSQSKASPYRFLQSTIMRMVSISMSITLDTNKSHRYY